MNERDIADLLEKSDADLYALLGQRLQETERGFRVHTAAEITAAARSWLQEKRGDLAGAICSSTVVGVYLKSESVSQRVMLAAALIDLTAKLMDQSVGAVVCVLLIKEGLSTLCLNRS